MFSLAITCTLLHAMPLLYLPCSPRVALRWLSGFSLHVIHTPAFLDHGHFILTTYRATLGISHDAPSSCGARDAHYARRPPDASAGSYDLCQPAPPRAAGRLQSQPHLSLRVDSRGSVDTRCAWQRRVADPLPNERERAHESSGIHHPYELPRIHIDLVSSTCCLSSLGN